MIRCIIAEDEKILRKGLILTTDWNSLGCEIVGEAENGKQALDIFIKEKPDLLITDIRMPVMDGLELIEKAKEYMDAEFIIMSGYNDFSYAKKAIHLGVSEYILKPLDEDEFIDAIIHVKKKLQKKKLSAMTNTETIDTNEKQQPTDSMEYFISQNQSKNRYICEAIKYIQKHYDQDIALKDICKSLLISESYLTKLFKEHLNYSFIDYLTHCRIYRACELLIKPDIKIYSVAEQVGYKDQRYFSVIFKKITGLTPKEYQNKKSEYS